MDLAIKNLKFLFSKIYINSGSPPQGKIKQNHPTPLPQPAAQKTLKKHKRKKRKSQVCWRKREKGRKEKTEGKRQ